MAHIIRTIFLLPRHEVSERVIKKVEATKFGLPGLPKSTLFDTSCEKKIWESKIKTHDQVDVPTSNNTSASFSQIPTTHFFFTNTLLVLPVLPNISTDEKFTCLTLDVSSSFVSRSHHGSANRGNYPDTWQRAKRIFSFNDKLSKLSVKLQNIFFINRLITIRYDKCE